MSAPVTNRWVVAARPATLPAAIAPVTVGTALAVRDAAFRWDVLLVTLLAALAIQVGVNFANDVADAARGADTTARIGPARAVASGLVTPRQMWTGIAVVFAVAAACGVYLTTVAGPVVLAIGAASLLAALGYTNGPVPYGYYGLGEVFVFVFFGLVATVGTRFVYDGTVTSGAWEGGVAMGFLAAAILVANNVRDIDTDRMAGKRTLAVLLGRGRTRVLFTVLVVGAFLAVVTAVVRAAVPAVTLVTLAAVPLAVGPVSAVVGRSDGPSLIAALRGTARLQLAVAALWFVGVVAG
jgi:1,4-dihydroxy-2-naphthoate octaprenyltransferase